MAKLATRKELLEISRCIRELFMAITVFCLSDLVLYVPSTIFQLCRDRSSWVEPVLSLGKCVLHEDTTQ